MTFEILNWTPISGEYEEKHFGQTDVHPLWIKFFPSNSLCWIGSFARGGTGFENEKICDIKDSTLIAILTDGKFYIIDRDSKELLCNPEPDYFHDFEIIPENNLILLAAYFGIYIFKNFDLIKVIRPDFIDGVRFNKKANDKLYGDIYEPGDNWYPFELDLNNLKLKWRNFEY